MVYSGFCSKCNETATLSYANYPGDAIEHRCANCKGTMLLTLDVQNVDLVA